MNQKNLWKGKPKTFPKDDPIGSNLVFDGKKSVPMRQTVVTAR